MSRLIAGACVLTAALCLAACGTEDSIEETVPDDPAVTPAGPDWMPEDDGNSAPSGGIRNPCDRAMCWDLDRRAWVSDPPPDYVIVSVEEITDPVDQRETGLADVLQPARLRINIRTAAGR
jgi:hypothetical protein